MRDPFDLFMNFTARLARLAFPRYTSRRPVDHHTHDPEPEPVVKWCHRCLAEVVHDWHYWALDFEGAWLCSECGDEW